MPKHKLSHLTAANLVKAGKKGLMSRAVGF